MSTHDPATLAYVAQVFRDVARAGGTHIDDDVGTSTGAELSPAACEAAARLVEGLGGRAAAATCVRCGRRRDAHNVRHPFVGATREEGKR